jgi:RecB family exonuclease
MTRQHIASAAVADQLIFKRLGETTVLAGERFHALNVLLETLHSNDRTLEWMRLAAWCENYRDPHQLLDALLKYPQTVDQIQRFLHRFYDENFTLEDLPERSPKDQALKALMRALVPEFQGRAHQWAALEASDPRSYTVAWGWHSYAHTQRLNALVERGAIRDPWTPTSPEVKLRYASNPRLEADAIARDLLNISGSYEAVGVLALDPQQIPYLQHALRELNLPHHVYGQRLPNRAAQLMRDALSCRLEPTHDHLVKLLQNDALASETMDALVQWVRLFELNPAELLASDFITPYPLDDHLNAILPIEALTQLHQHAALAFHQHVDQLKALFSAETDIDAHLERSFDFCVELLTTDSGLSALRDLMERIHPTLNALAQPWPHLLHQLDQLTLSPTKVSGVRIVPLNQGLLPHLEVLYLMGATHEHYPQLSDERGLFDERYLQAIQAYDPSKRHRFHMDQLEQVLHSAPQVVISYSLGNFDGKARKLALELERFSERVGVVAQAWPMHRPPQREANSQIQLDPRTAQALFFKDQRLRGSATRFERYFTCSYQYFLRHGLHLQSTQELRFSPLWLGNLLHHALEQAIERSGLNYTQDLRTISLDELRLKLQALQTLFPKKALELKRIERRMRDALILLAENFERQDAAGFEVRSREVEKDLHVVRTRPDAEVEILGRIDRVDHHAHGFTLYDYKSSKRNLSATKVAAGVQLQLPLYLSVVRHEAGMGEPYAMGYISLKQENVPIIALKHNNRLKSAEADDAPDTLWAKEHRAKMWDLARYDADQLEAHVDALLDQMIQNLKAGRLEKHHREHSCTQCEFKSFCQFSQAMERLPKVEAKRFKKVDDESD